MDHSSDRRKGGERSPASSLVEDYQATNNTLARLQRELDRWKAGKSQLPPEGRSRLHLELERERLMRVEAELNRLEEASQLDTSGHRPLGQDVQLDSRTRPPGDMPVDANGCMSRPPDMQLDANTCRARLHALQEDFRKMEEMVASMVQYKAKIDQLKQENASMKSSYEANLRKYCSHISGLERDNMVLMNQAKNMESQIHGKGDDRDKSKLLLERLRMVEAENSSLVLENEQQRQQYEKCLDEIANQVVQALLAQKTLREECLKLQARVKDLELQNKHLNLMFQQRMRITSNDSVGNITLNFNDNGGSLHSMCSEIMGDDSPGKPQLSSPPSWMQEKMAPSPGPEGNFSPSSSSSCSAPSPSTPESQDQVLRTKIETEFPATNASPKMKHISVFERRSRSLERGSSGPFGWAQKMLRGGRRRSESQEKNYPPSQKLKQSTSADALTHYGVKNKMSSSLSQTSIDTSSWRDSLSQERLCAKDAKLLLRTSSTGNGKGELSSQVCDINHQSFEAFNRSFEKLLAKKLPDEKQKDSSRRENQKDNVNNARQTSTVSAKKSESTISDQKSKPKTSAATSTTSSVKTHPSGHHQKVRPSPALRNPFADPMKSPKSPSPIPGQYYYYDYSDEDSDSRPVSRDFSTASTMSLNEILDSSTEGEVPLDDDFFSDWSSVCISPQKRIDRLTGQTISNNAMVSMLQQTKRTSSSVSQSTSSSSSSPDSSKLSAAGINSSTVIRAPTTSSKTNNKVTTIVRTGKQKAEPIYDTPYVPKTVPSPVISKTVSQQAVTRSLVENSPLISNANTTQVTAEVHADSSFHPSPSLSPNPSQLSQDQGYASKGSYSQSSPSPSPSLSHRGTPPWLHSTKDPHSFSRNELLTLVINREALSSSPRAIPSGSSPGDSPRLARPGKLILVPEDKNYNIQGFSSVSSTSSEDKSPIKMFESRHNEDMKSSVIEMKKDNQTLTPPAQAKADGQKSLPNSSMPESPSSPQSKGKNPPPVAKKPVKAVKPEARSPPKDASTSPRDKYCKVPNPNNNNVTVGFLLHNQSYPAQHTMAMDFLVSSMIKEVKNQVFKQHPELGNPFQTKICQSSDSSFENLRVERSGSKDDGYSTMSSDVHPEIMEKFCDTLSWKLLESEADSVGNKSASLKIKSEGPFLTERRNSDSVINTKDRSIELISDQDSAMDSSLHSTAEMATSSSSQVSNSSTDVTSPSSTNVSRIAKLFEGSPVKSNSMKGSKPSESLQSSPLRSPTSPMTPMTPVPSCFPQPESPRRLANEFQKPAGNQVAGAAKKKTGQVNSPKQSINSSKQSQQPQKSSPLENAKEKKDLPSTGIPVLSSGKRNESKSKACLTNEQTKEKSQYSSTSLPRNGTAASKNSNKSPSQVPALTRRKSNESNEFAQKNESGTSKIRSSASRNITSSPAPDKKNLIKGSCVPSPSSSTKRQKKNDGKSKISKMAPENSNQGKIGSAGKRNKTDSCGRPPVAPSIKDKETDGPGQNCKENSPLIPSTSSDVEKHEGDLNSAGSANSTSLPSSGETYNCSMLKKGSDQSQNSSPDSASKKPFIVLTNQCFQMVSSDSDEETDTFRPSYVMTGTSSFQRKNVLNTSEECSSSADSSVSLSWQQRNNNLISSSASASVVARSNSCTNFSPDIAAHNNNEDTKVTAHVSNSRPSPCLPNVSPSSSSSTSSMHSSKQWDLSNGSQNQHFSTAQSYTSSSTSSSNSDFPSKANSLHQSKDNDIPCLWRSRSEHSVLGSRPKSTSCIETLYEQAWDSGKLLERSTSDSEIDSLMERLQVNGHSLSPDENVFHQKCLTSVMTTEKNFNYAPNQSHYFHRFHGFHNVYRYSHQRADPFHPVTHSLRLDLSDVTELDEESSELASTRDSMDTSNGQLGNTTGDDSPRLIADEQKQFNSQFYSLCQMGSSKSLLSSSYGSGEKLSLTSLNDILGNKSFERESEGDSSQLNSEDRIAIKEFDEISRQIASLSKTVDELNHSLSSLNSGEFETSHKDNSTACNKSSSKCDVIDGYHWADDEMYLTSCNGERISDNQDLPRDSFADIFNASTQNSSSDLNSTEDARDEFCMVSVSQRSSIQKYLNVPDSKTGANRAALRRWESEGNLSCELNSKDMKNNRLSVPVFWTSSDKVDRETSKSNHHSSGEQNEVGEKFHSSIGSNIDSDDSLASDIGLDHMMCQRLIGPKGRISHPSARPAVDLSTLFHHYEESEQEAIAAFDFLDNVSVAESNADIPLPDRSEKVECEDSVERSSSVPAVDNQYGGEENVCIKIEISAENSSNLAVKETRDIGVDAMSRSQASLTTSFEICNDPCEMFNNITTSSSSSLSLSFANQSYAASDESKLIPSEDHHPVVMPHADYCNTMTFMDSGGNMDIVSCGGCTAKRNTPLSMAVAEKQSCVAMDKTDVTSYSDFVADLKMCAVKDGSPPDLPPRCPLKSDDTFSTFEIHPPPPPPPPLPQRLYTTTTSGNAASAVPRRTHIQTSFRHHTYHSQHSFHHQKHPHQYNPHAPYVNQTIPRMQPVSSEDRSTNPRLHADPNRNKKQPEISRTQDGRPQVMIRPQRLQQEKKVKQMQDRPHSFTHYTTHQVKSESKSVSSHAVSAVQMSLTYSDGGGGSNRTSKGNDKDENSLSKIPKRKLKSRRERTLRKKNSVQLNPEGGSNKVCEGAGEISHSWRDISAENGLPLSDSSGADNSSS